MSDPERPTPPDHSISSEYGGPERRSGLERRQSRDPQPPPGQEERRKSVRRKADRIALEGKATAGGLGASGRLYRRVQLEVPVIYRPLRSDFTPDQAARRGRTHDLSQGGLGLVLEEHLPAGSSAEVLIRFDKDLLAADVLVIGVIPQGEGFLHNCRFTRLGPADRKWLTEHLRKQDGGRS